jgi:hypothetical protein
MPLLRAADASRAVSCLAGQLVGILPQSIPWTACVTLREVGHWWPSKEAKMGRSVFTWACTGLRYAAMVCSVGLVACGGGGGGGGSATEPPPVVTPPTPPVVTPPPAPTSTAITLQSDAGDWIGQGKTYSYDPTSALISVAVSPQGRLTLEVKGDEQWTSDLQPPAGTSTLAVGRYDGLPTTSATDLSRGAFRWFGGGRGCAASVARVDVDQVAYAGGGLSSISFRFVRFCDGATVALRGEVKWTRSDTRSMPALPMAIPSDLWHPPAAAVPAAGDYVILESGAGDPVALGRSLRYTTSESSIFVSTGPSHELTVQVSGKERWIGLVQLPEALVGKPVVGYYPGLRRTPLHNPGRGGLNWAGEGRSCLALQGWLVIDRVELAQSTITALEARFEQRCQGSAGVLRGALRWTAPARIPAPQPLSAPGDWSADALLPASGNVLYVESGRADYMGGRLTHTATPLDALLTVRETDGLLAVESNGEQRWFGRVRPSAGSGPLSAGSFPGLARLLVDTLPGQTWSMGSSCTLQESWLVIDDVQYRGAQLAAIRLRFDGRCSDTGDVLRGQLRWSDADQGQPPGPQPVPDTFWRAVAGQAPASGNFLLLEADPWLSISSDQQPRFTQADAVMQVAADGAGLALRLRGEAYHDGRFQPMAGQARLQPGYYPGLTELPFNNPAKGGMAWPGDAHGCSQFTGSFVVDSISYIGDRLDAVDLRFEQNCVDALVASVRGQLRWRSDDPTQPPGPVLPVPAALWKPAAGTTPSSGTYLYMHSLPGDFVGAGQTTLVTPANAPFVVTPRDRGVDIEVGSLLTGWSGHLEPMSSRQQLEPGYYPVLKRYPSRYNPARGGLSWSGMGRGCNEATGWFVVDAVSYSGDTLTSLQARFEQYCDDSPGPLRGEIRWSR